MKQKILNLFILNLFIIGSLSSQIADGSVAPNFTATDQFGNTHTLNDYISQGKTVIIDISATWCGPCWNYHQSHALSDLYNAYGPNGSDEIMVFFVEGDGSTNTADLNGTGNSTLGDWITGTPYPVIDDASIASAYQIAFYPTVFRVCPDGLVYEQGASNVSTLVSSVGSNCSQTLQGATDHGKISDSELALCTANGTPEFSISNYGTNNITSATVTLNENGTTVGTANFSGNISQFSSATVSFNSMPLNTSATYTATLDNINGNTPANMTMTNAALAATSANSSLTDVTVNFFTDNYPGETRWEILDGSLTVVASGGPYTPGTADQWGGGGPDANTTMTSTHVLSANECYSVRLFDSFGDGQQYGTGTNPNGGFGIQITDANGEVYNWDPGAGWSVVAEEGVLKTNPSTAIEELSNKVLTVYPNPINEYANIEFIADNSSATRIEVLNSIGQIVFNKSLGIVEGEQVVNLNAGNLSSGYYFIQVRSGKNIYNSRITVNK
tara:strand:- start:1655 stop:3154 length:1500 start_codon:yes stop_codon:yes gene_type:complete